LVLYHPQWSIFGQKADLDHFVSSTGGSANLDSRATVAPATTDSNTDDYDYDYSSTTLVTTETEATENTDTTEEATEETTEDSTVDSTEENTDGTDSGEILECENPNPEVITIGNGTILQAYCDEGSLNGTR